MGIRKDIDDNYQEGVFLGASKLAKYWKQGDLIPTDELRTEGRWLFGIFILTVVISLSAYLFIMHGFMEDKW